MGEEEINENKLRLTILIEEYRALREEIRTFEILISIFSALAIFTFMIMFMASIAFDRQIILFIAPMISMLFVIISLILFSFSTNVGLLASEVEDSINDISGQKVLKWELTMGLLGGRPKDFILKRISNFWLKISTLGLVIVGILVVTTLVYEMESFQRDLGYLAWIIFILDMGIIIATFVLGYSFIVGSWRRIK